MEDDIIKLKSGKEIYANKLLISCKFTDVWELYYGYDGQIYLSDWGNDLKGYPLFTKYDLYEIADIMIERWQQFKRDVANNKVLVKD